MVAAMDSSTYTRPPPGLHNRQSPISTSSAMDSITREYEAMQQAELARHQFVENLMKHISTLTNERDEATRKLQRSEFTCNAYQDQLTLADRKIDDLQKSMDCDRFVLAVVDGDSALFEDEYVRDGSAGGERAAHKLQQAIFDYLKDKPYFQHDFKIVIKIFVNLQGLFRPYGENKIIPGPPTLYQFVQGFNKTYELVEIVDAGNLKEAADSKVKATLSLYRRNLHCKHILLAASGDNSYAGFLRQFMEASGASDKLTLIESLPFARDLAQLATIFQTTKFEGVFRSTKIVTEPRLTGMAAVREPLKESTGNAWSMPASATTTLPVRTIKTPEVATATPFTPKPVKEIWVNAYDERIDTYIKHNTTIYNDLKRKKKCNKYWLNGSCDNPRCAHDHGGSLSTAELEQLRLIARTCSCRIGLACRDPDCVDGHRCVHGEKCTNKDCWFDDDMHNVSMDGVKSIQVPVDANSYIHVR